MQKIQRTIEIKAPVQNVYDFVNQPTNLLSIWPNMVSVSNVVAKPGGAHDFDWVFKMVGIQFKGHAAIEDAQSGKFVRVTNEGGIPSTFLWTYTGTNGAGTRLSLSVEYSMPTPVIGRLAEVVAAKINERDLDTMLGNLKDVMEHGLTAVAARAPAHH